MSRARDLGPRLSRLEGASLLEVVCDALTTADLAVLGATCEVLKHVSTSTAVRRAQRMYSDAIAGTLLGVSPARLGLRYLKGRELPSLAPRLARLSALPAGIASLGAAAWTTTSSSILISPYEDGRDAGEMAYERGAGEMAAMRALLPAGAEDDTVFFVQVFRKRATDRVRRAVVQQTVPASLLRKPVHIRRAPEFEALRSWQPGYDGVQEPTTPEHYFGFVGYEPEVAEHQAYHTYARSRWEAHRRILFI